MKWKLAVLVPITLRFSSRRVYFIWDQAKNHPSSHQAKRIWREGMLMTARGGQWNEPRFLTISLEGKYTFCKLKSIKLVLSQTATDFHILNPFLRWVNIYRLAPFQIYRLCKCILSMTTKPKHTLYRTQFLLFQNPWGAAGKQMFSA